MAASKQYEQTVDILGAGGEYRQAPIMPDAPHGGHQGASSGRSGDLSVGHVCQRTQTKGVESVPVPVLQNNTEGGGQAYTYTYTEGGGHAYHPVQSSRHPSPIML